jgi:hypothetical protein
MLDDNKIILDNNKIMLNNNKIMLNNNKIMLNNNKIMLNNNKIMSLFPHAYVRSEYGLSGYLLKLKFSKLLPFKINLIYKRVLIIRMYRW